MERRGLHCVEVACLALIVVALAGGNGAGAAQRQTPGPSKTYEHPRWGVALDYPADWSVEDDGDEVTFRSSSGASVVLGLGSSDARSDPAPGRRAEPPQCTTTTTARDVTATTCVDAASHTRRAVLVLDARTNRERRVSLRARGGEYQVFDAMVASVRAIRAAAPAARFPVRESPRTARAMPNRS